MRECKFCKDEIPDSFVDNQCDGCWEVTSRLHNFLKSKDARKLVKNELELYSNE